MGRGLPGRGGGLLRVHDHRRGVLGRPGPRPADHVRRRRRARPHRARAAAPARGGGTAARSGWATARGTRARSTCTASCSAPRCGSPTSWTRSTTTPGGSWSPARTPRPRSWTQKDQGIWEVRGEPQRLPLLQGDVLGRAGPGDRARRPDRRAPTGSRGGRAPARRSGTTVVRDGWNEQAGAFTQYVRLDRPGRLEPDDGDRRVPAGRRPADAGHHRRHRGGGSPTSGAWSTATAPTEGVDGLAGEEGTFLLCTFWLAQALALSGQVDRATAVFERAVAFVNDVGLLAEEVDAGVRRAARQLPAGVQPHRPGQRGLGHLARPGRRRRAPVR